GDCLHPAPHLRRCRRPERPLRGAPRLTDRPVPPPRRRRPFEPPLREMPRLTDRPVPLPAVAACLNPRSVGRRARPEGLLCSFLRGLFCRRSLGHSAPIRRWGGVGVRRRRSPTTR